MLIIDQTRITFSEERGSKQFLASPSMMMWFQSSSFASWAAQRMAEALATIGELKVWILDQILMMSPTLSLATTAKAEDELESVASTFNLIQRLGGASLLAGGRAELGEASSFVNKAEYSFN